MSREAKAKLSGGWEVTALTSGPGRLLRGGHYDVDMPPTFSGDCQDLADWLNARSENGWRLLLVHNGMFVFQKV